MDTTRHKAKSRPALLLVGFVLLSILIHGLFLASRFGEETRAVDLVQLAPDLQVIVVSSRGAKSVNNDTVIQQPPPIARTTADDPPQTDSTASVNQQARAVSPTGPAQSSIVEPKSTNSPVTHTQTVNTLKAVPQADVVNDVQLTDETPHAQPAPVNHLRAQLRSQLARHFIYPRLARRMGWEGEVGLGLHIAEDGRLGKIHVVRSSGYKVLDENARSTLDRIGRITVASNMVISPVDTEIEVLYRLTD